MKITRIIDGCSVEIELTKHELFSAYKEQEHEFDMTNCEFLFNSGIYDGEEWMKKITEEERNKIIEEMAAEYRANMDEYEMGHEHALDDAADVVLRRYMRLMSEKG